MKEADQSDLLDAARGYEKLFVPALFAPWTTHLLEAVAVQHGSRLLDLACGTGVLAREALKRVGPSGQVVGVDPAPGMIGVARDLEPGVRWELGSAEALKLDDAQFDCLVSQFGMMFFQDRVQAVAEMSRVLKPGGRLAIAVWNSVAENPAYGQVIAVLEDQVGPAAGDAVRLPFSLGDHSDVTVLLSDAGFDAVAVETRQETGRFPTPRQMVEAELRGWLPLFGIHLDDAKIAEVLSVSEPALAAYTAASGEAEFPTSAHIISARKPA